MEGSEQWEWVRQKARRVLSRYRDPDTRELCDDMVQETSLLAWQWFGKLSDPDRFGAAVSTIAKRHRARELARMKRRGWLQYVEFGSPGAVEPATSEDEDEYLSIGDQTVSLPWARHRLASVLKTLPLLDQKLLLSFHEGFCCAELASRFGRSEDCIKTRIHRARQRVRSVFEELVRSSGEMDKPELEE